MIRDLTQWNDQNRIHADMAIETEFVFLKLQFDNFFKFFLKYEHKLIGPYVLASERSSFLLYKEKMLAHFYGDGNLPCASDC